MTDNVGEIVRCLLRDLETYPHAIRYADRIARANVAAEDRRLQNAYARAADRLRAMELAAWELAGRRTPRPWEEY